METDYVSWKLGMSEKRGRWLVDWLRKTVREGVIEPREMAQGLGRLGFSAMALDWERPFLGPLYAWSSAIFGKPGIKRVPVMLRVLMSWIADRLCRGERLQRPSPPPTPQTPFVFFTDAKAVEDRAWVGGFLEISPGCQGPWFSLEVEKDWAPWAFCKKDMKRVTAALELLGTLITIRLWVPDSQRRQRGQMKIKGWTDDQSNAYLLRKRMSTKFPSTLLLIEIAEELDRKSCELELSWLRREENQLADDLTNEKFESFDSQLRVPLKGRELRWRVLDELLGTAGSFYEQLEAVRKTATPKAAGKRKAGKLGPW
jgi:hypothetical protein